MMAYSTVSDVRKIVGDNADKWADVGGGLTVEQRIEYAITIADAQIDAAMRNTWYKVPLQDESSSTPTLITEVSATLAAVWLYEARGSSDIDPKTGEPVHRMLFKKKWAWEVIQGIRNGTLDVGLVKK